MKSFFLNVILVLQIVISAGRPQTSFRSICSKNSNLCLWFGSWYGTWGLIFPTFTIEVPTSVLWTENENLRHMIQTIHRSGIWFRPSSAKLELSWVATEISRTKIGQNFQKEFWLCHWHYSNPTSLVVWVAATLIGTKANSIILKGWNLSACDV